MLSLDLLLLESAEPSLHHRLESKINKLLNDLSNTITICLYFV